ncbi:phBC6A51 family helix-turn-helix protein [Paenibacillus filicis]|uniref:PhBC6A51 family helix-turn-helix protein n=1 Tax=Paenibacillus gyeongsangnamensis TaxID=3388067 RepID=A0ABT4Q6G0_9BACL|nr:phBC6A51 family helix-turn-helix protein [Paenibacillus filicis]MCZ8512416.1 phBC6A51 family helix-turn-helix protein [Paenibacillus filicis]
MKKLSKLKSEQQKAIKLLTALDLKLNDGESKKMTYDTIAKECGVSQRTLFNWRTNDPDFIEARDEFTESVADEHLAKIYNSIIEQAVKKQNMKAAELFLKSRGKLKDNTHITADVNTNINESNKTTDDLKRELDELRNSVLKSE